MKWHSYLDPDSKLQSPHLYQDTCHHHIGVMESYIYVYVGAT